MDRFHVGKLEHHDRPLIMFAFQYLHFCASGDKRRSLNLIALAGPRSPDSSIIDHPRLRNRLDTDSGLKVHDIEKETSRRQRTGARNRLLVARSSVKALNPFSDVEEGTFGGWELRPHGEKSVDLTREVTMKDGHACLG